MITSQFIATQGFLTRYYRYFFHREREIYDMQTTDESRVTLCFGGMIMLTLKSRKEYLQENICDIPITSRFKDTSYNLPPQPMYGI